MNSKFKQIRNYSLILIVIVLAVFLFMFNANQMTTSGLYKIVNKSVDANHYYIEILDKHVECTANEFNLIVEGLDYDITFVWNEFLPTQGHLKRIVPFGVMSP